MAKQRVMVEQKVRIGHSMKEIEDVVAEIRSAFDGDDLARKNRALRWSNNAIRDTIDRIAALEAQLAARTGALSRAISLVEAVITNDPNEPVSDAGHTALDAWQYELESLKAALSPAPEAHQKPVAWRWRPRGGDVWVCWGSEPKPGENLVEDAVVEIEPLYTRPAEQAVTEAMELARAVLARVMTAGYPNAPGPDPEDVEKAFWALDDALKAAMEAGR